MKNVIKKIAAAVMAFTLIGTGTAVTKTIAPQADNTLTASAKSDWEYKGNFKTAYFERENGSYVNFNGNLTIWKNGSTYCVRQMGVPFDQYVYNVLWFIAI